MWAERTLQLYRLSSAHSQPQLLSDLCIHACASWVMPGAPLSFSLQHLHFVSDLPTPLLIHSLTYPPHTHSLIHPLPHSATLLLPPSSNCACIYSLADFLIFQPLAHSDNSINLSSIPHTRSLIIHSHTHSASQIPTHSLMHLSTTSFLQLCSRLLNSNIPWVFVPNLPEILRVEE